MSQRSLQASTGRLSLPQIHLVKGGKMLEQKPGASIRITW
jgi:hypothetical protein